MRPVLTTPPRMPSPGHRQVTSPPRMQATGIRRSRFAGLAGSSSTAPINDTGMRGFLKWAQREYPAALYQHIAAQIQQQVPQAFSGYMLGGWRKMGRLNGLADGTTGTVDTSDAANSTPADMTWANTISQIIGTSTAAYLNVAQQQNQNAIVQTQLQQAQAGKAPVNVSLGSSGISFGTTAGLTVGGLVIIGALGLLVLKATKVI
jgi:N-acetylmuramic acid 6-phosphate (MurNAc-6-P) etherase